MAAKGLIIRLSKRMAQRTPHTFPTERRASVAIIMRIADHPAKFPTRTGHSRLQLDEFLSSEAASQSTWDNSQILYIKRTSHPSDPWSGNVAFPGGKRDPGETDYEAAVREVREEINLDLEHGPFTYVGRLDDRPVYARGRQAGSFALCPFVFLQTVPDTPPMTLSKDEVAAVRWVPIAALVEDNVNLMGITMPFRFIPALHSVPTPIKSLLGIDVAHYPAISLPYNGGNELLTNLDTKNPSGRFTMSPSSLAAGVLAELSTASPVSANNSMVQTDAPDHMYDNPSQQFQLWGLTLQATSDLLSLVDLRRLNWPPLRLNGWVSNFLIYAVCGAIELRDCAVGMRSFREVRGKHVGALALALAAPALLAYLLLF